MPDRAAQLLEFQQLIDSGRLRLGMSRAEVKVLLGEPDHVGNTSRRYRTPSIYKYGHVEVFFGPRASDGLTSVYSEDEQGENPVYRVPPEP